jgi:tricarballylate dehydrogenase
MHRKLSRRAGPRGGVGAGTPQHDGADVDDRAGALVVVGSGNAGLCAAVSAAQSGARVLLVEKASRERRGGNSRFAALYRFPYDGFEDLIALCPELDDWRDRATVGPYPDSRFHADLLLSSSDGTDEALMKIVSSSARATVRDAGSGGR